MHIATAADVLAWGWTHEDLLRRLIVLDRQLLGDNLPDADEGTVAQWAPVFAAQPELYAFLSPAPGEIVGYWHGAAVSDATFARALNGTLLDSEITTATLVPLSQPGPVNLYLVFIGVLPAHRAHTGLLVRAAIAQTVELEAHGVTFRGACSTAYTKEGANLLEQLGFERGGAHVSGGTVYARGPFSAKTLAR